MSETAGQLAERQEQLKNALIADDSDSEDSEEDSSDLFGETSCAQSGLATQFNSGTQNLAEENKESNSEVSYRSDFSSTQNQVKAPLDKATCLKILQLIISAKREQAFCQSADKEIFLTIERSS